MKPLVKLSKWYMNATNISQVTCSNEVHSSINLALLYRILLKEKNSLSDLFQLLASIVQDGFLFVLSNLKYFTGRCYGKLSSAVKDNLFWLVNQLIELSVVGIEDVVLNLLRHIKSKIITDRSAGNYCEENVNLCEDMLQIASLNRTWLYQFPTVVASYCFTFLRLITDHNKQSLLQQREISLVVTLLEDRFEDCKMIGRDLIRILQEVARLPAFQSIWKKVLSSDCTIYCNC